MDSSLLLPPPTTSAANKSSPSSSRGGPTNPLQTDRFRRMPESQLEHTQHAIEIFLLVHIWLESLLRVRSAEISQNSHLEAPKTLSNNAHPEGNHLFSTRLPVDVTLVPGLAGLGDVPDPKVTLVHKAGDKLDLCKCFRYFPLTCLMICNGEWYYLHAGHILFTQIETQRRYI